MQMSSREIVQSFEMGFRPVFWPQSGDAKGPREAGWPNKRQGLEEYREGSRHSHRHRNRPRSGRAHRPTCEGTSRSLAFCTTWTSTGLPAV